MKFDFITIGGLTEDVVFFSNDGMLIDNPGDLLKQKLLAFEQGAKINISQSETGFGGGASNAAVNFSNLGFKVACLGRLGADERSLRILENLKRHKVNCQNIDIDKKQESGFSFVLNNKQDRIIFTYRGANDSFKVEKKHLAVIKDSAWVYLSSLPGDSLSSLKHIFSAKNKIAWNPGLKQLSGDISKISSFLKKTDILLLNKDEALELVKKSNDFKGLSNDFLNDSGNLIKLIKKFGSDKIILTDGVFGSYFYDGNNLYKQTALKAKKCVDVTGVGDAFNSTSVAFLYKLKGDYKKALSYGAKNAASLVTRVGAQNGLLPLNKIIK